MEAILRKDIHAGHSHQQRLMIANQLAGRILSRHGEAVAAIVVFGSTAADADGPYSDLDITVVTHADLGSQSKCYPYQFLQINLDYQTVQESFDEAREPHGGGCWLTCIPLFDPEELTRQLAATYLAISHRSCEEAFARLVRDDLSTAIGKMRNAVVANDRPSFVAAACAFSEATCRSLCVLNANRAIAYSGELTAVAKSLPIVPPRFGELIDIISGSVPLCDQAVYDAAEDLWASLIELAEQRGLCWHESALLV